MAQPKLWTQELDLCLESARQFKTHFESILYNITNGDLGYRSFFLSRIFSIISSKQPSPTSRFYALYLLFLASIEGGTPFVNQLAQQEELLNFIYQVAQHESTKKIAFDERGKCYFTKNPSPVEARAGVNFVRLSIEALVYWEETYGESDPKHPCYCFVLYSSTLKKKMKLSSFYYFINKKYDLSQDLSTWNFYNMLPKTVDGLFQDSPSKKANKNVIAYAEESQEESEIEDDPWKNEPMSNKAESPLHKTEEDLQFLNLLKKASKRHQDVDRKTESPPLFSPIKKEQKASPQELIKEIMEDKKCASLSQQLNLQNSIHYLEEVFSPIYSNGLVTPSDTLTQTELNKAFNKETNLSHDDIKDEDIDENKSAIDIKQTKGQEKNILTASLEFQLTGPSSTLQKGASVSMTHIPISPIKNLRTQSNHEDAKHLSKGKCKDTKIASELLEIQKSIEKSKVKFPGPACSSTTELSKQEHFTPKFFKRQDSKSYTCLDRDHRDLNTIIDESDVSDRSIEGLTPGPLLKNHSHPVTSQKMFTQKTDLGARFEEIMQKEHRLNTQPTQRIMLISPKDASNIEENRFLDGRSTPDSAGQGVRRVKTEQRDTSLNELVKKKAENIDDKYRNHSDRDIRKARILNMLAENPSNSKKEKDPFSIYHHEEYGSMSTASRYVERTVHTNTSNSQSYLLDAGKLSPYRPTQGSAGQIGGDISAYSSEMRKSNEYPRTTDAQYNKGNGFPIYSFNQDLRKKDEGSWFSSPMSEKNEEKGREYRVTCVTEGPESFRESPAAFLPFTICKKKQETGGPRGV